MDTHTKADKTTDSQIFISICTKPSQTSQASIWKVNVEMLWPTVLKTTLCLYHYAIGL